ncbi:MAG: type II toxin-antitoxin system prevent-host-death family antitoxin [Actinobacteria bacterium]|nr:type II toxin-antitoxin system prevent-host-death family antitoxin [Actinomycetota bacterium]
MELSDRMVGLEEARGKLGQLLEEVTRTGEPVILAKRGQTFGVLLSRDEYSRLKLAATRLAREELASRLAAARRRVEEAGLDPSEVDAAIAAARRLDTA